MLGSRRAAGFVERRSRLSERAPVQKLRNTVMPYDWGSRTAIARLTGRPAPSPQPEAELWIGAHAIAPSRLAGPAGQLTLDEEIARQPARALGNEARAQFGDRLPFLLKILAAERPLSLQAHPTVSQARSGYEREERLGIPLDARNRNYKDRNHKPELICALEPFDALCGFRATPETVNLLRSLHIPGLEAVVLLLEESPGPSGLRAVFRQLLRTDAHEASRLIGQVQAACRRLAEAGSRWEAQLRWTERLAALHPADMGVISSLLLNFVRLAPGEALALPAGNLHSYLHGTGVEIMASSDNVLRGGLTTKHVDVDELLAVVDFSDGPALPVSTRRLSEHETEYVTAFAEFRLTTIRVAGTESCRPERGGPELLLCTSGEATVAIAGAARLDLHQGESAFVYASDGNYEVRGNATVFRASVARFGRSEAFRD
jgi:mannose-6-phosphate isomerase